MHCPYLTIRERSKTCKRMLEEGLDDEVADFDVKHYCKGNPTCCYYFRTSTKPFKIDEKSAGKETSNDFTIVSQGA